MDAQTLWKHNASNHYIGEGKKTEVNMRNSASKQWTGLSQYTIYLIQENHWLRDTTTLSRKSCRGEFPKFIFG